MPTCTCTSVGVTASAVRMVNKKHPQPQPKWLGAHRQMIVACWCGIVIGAAVLAGCDKPQPKRGNYKQSALAPWNRTIVSSSGKAPHYTGMGITSAALRSRSELWLCDDATANGADPKGAWEDVSTNRGTAYGYSRRYVYIGRQVDLEPVSVGMAQALQRTDGPSLRRLLGGEPDIAQDPLFDIVHAAAARAGTMSDANMPLYVLSCSVSLLQSSWQRSGCNIFVGTVRYGQNENTVVWGGAPSDIVCRIREKVPENLANGLYINVRTWKDPDDAIEYPASGNSGRGAPQRLSTPGGVFSGVWIDDMFYAGCLGVVDSHSSLRCRDKDDAFFGKWVVYRMTVDRIKVFPPVIPDYSPTIDS
jgi:hypothetical protein